VRTWQIAQVQTVPAVISEIDRSASAQVVPKQASVPAQAILATSLVWIGQFARVNAQGHRMAGGLAPTGQVYPIGPEGQSIDLARVIGQGGLVAEVIGPALAIGRVGQEAEAIAPASATVPTDPIGSAVGEGLVPIVLADRIGAMAASTTGLIGPTVLGSEVFTIVGLVRDGQATG